MDVLFLDFGGVIAEEGFFEGLNFIASRHDLDPASLAEAAVDAMFKGYVQGRESEDQYWRRMEDITGVGGLGVELRALILDGFRVRPRMLELADLCRSMGMAAAVLSDHTNWLEELDARHGFSRHFDHVFNSYRTGLTKREDACFLHALQTMDAAPERAVFVDDSRANVARAAALGINAVLCEDLDHAAGELARLCPPLAGFLSGGLDNGGSGSGRK